MLCRTLLWLSPSGSPENIDSSFGCFDLSFYRVIFVFGSRHLKAKRCPQRRRHDSLGETGRWLAQVYRGWQGYYGVPNNGRRLQQFRNAIFHLWLRQIRRRSQKGSKWTWARMGRLMRIHLPKPRITHPWPHVRFYARSKGGAV